MVNKNPKFKKIAKILITWLFIPIIIDIVSIFLLNDILPSFWIVRDFSLSATIATFVIWFIYAAAVAVFQYVRKKFGNNEEQKP